MITPPTATAELMLNSLIYTINALDAAANLDIDRTDVDRNFLATQKATLVNLFNVLQGAQTKLVQHTFSESTRHQAYVTVGDLVLDRGVRRAKNRLKMELELTRPAAADEVFGKNLEDLTRAELRSQPELVFQALDRMSALPDFPNKAQLQADINQRANNQQNSITARDQAERTHANLTNNIRNLIQDSSDALYGLEKLLLNHFLRDKSYVKGFFLDANPPKKKAKPVPPAPTT